MNQKEKISNSFSDSYLAALLEGMDNSEVIRKFSKDFPELASAFAANAKSLDLLYGDIRTVEKPSTDEIATAYKKVSERFGASAAHQVASKPSFFAELKSFFSASPMWAGATLGIGAAVIIALLWQPWVIKESLNETAQNKISTSNLPDNQHTSPEIASNDQTSIDPMKTPEVQYRGSKSKELLTATQRKQKDAIDAARLKQMATPKSLSAPENLHIESLTPGSIIITWDPSQDALSYIVEIKGENDANFEPVTQVSQTRTRITSLDRGKIYFVRVSATSGERKGPPSDAKSIVVP